ncbi:enoyl-CoA hydratase [Domibacillus epiphyticus]|uniref:Enoyl-CoA hydratase n=1 Tax=Domibacillus epiphyticus TaxID=1714355 RepID=A0A1V2A922_9BACI|nr:enoyl-CoA hydratase [Domibacillus epiphyticus]OMP67499.1 enoyl-CoA hydratase [Domibacillus epiphyticus]
MTYISVTKEKHIAEIVINRPPANALAGLVISEIEQALDTIENEPDIRVVILFGDGRFFSAGADIKEFTTISTAKEFSKVAARGQRVMERIESFPKPVIAAIHGAALGGGLELAMSCHIRYVTENAKLGLPELQLGIVPGFGGSQRLTRYVGMAKAAEMMLTSEPISGREAVQWGLANAAFSEEELLPSARKLAQTIAAKSPVSVNAVIELLNYAKHAEYYKGIEKEADYFGTVFSSDDAKEGIQAFIEKRPPEFKGR